MRLRQREQRCAARKAKACSVKSLRDLADEALRRIGVQTAPTRLEQAHSEGKTTQVPSGRRVVVAKRVRRKIGYNGVTISFERARPHNIHMLDLNHEAI